MSGSSDDSDDLSLSLHALVMEEGAGDMRGSDQRRRNQSTPTRPSSRPVDLGSGPGESTPRVEGTAGASGNFYRVSVVDQSPPRLPSNNHMRYSPARNQAHNPHMGAQSSNSALNASVSDAATQPHTHGQERSESSAACGSRSTPPLIVAARATAARTPASRLQGNRLSEPSAGQMGAMSRSGNSRVSHTGLAVNASGGNSHMRSQGEAHYNWQGDKGTVKERLAYIFNCETMADVHFRVGRGHTTQRVPAHKFVLSIGSAVFDAMFNGKMAANTSEDIDVPDVEPASFMALLKFLYTDEVNIDADSVMTTLYTAKKYAVPALERACVDFLKRNLTSDNAFLLLTQARLFDEPQLASLCLETIDKNTAEALGAEGFSDVDLDTLCVVLERDTLGIRESRLFEATCRWAEAESGRQALPPSAENRRKVLGRALALIRFPLMTVEEFAGGPAQVKLLTDREVVELFLYFTVNPKPTVSFMDNPRCCLTGREQVVSRFCHVESRWGYSGCSDRIRFMVNRRIFVVGFGVYGSIHGPSEYVVNIQIIHTDTNKVLGLNTTSFQCDGSSATFRVMFKEPVEVAPNTNYTACATLKGPDSYYGTKGLRKAQHDSHVSGKVVFQFTYAAGNNNGTSVEDGQIPEIIFYT